MEQRGDFFGNCLAGLGIGDATLGGSDLKDNHPGQLRDFPAGKSRALALELLSPTPSRLGPAQLFNKERLEIESVEVFAGGSRVKRHIRIFLLWR